MKKIFLAAVGLIAVAPTLLATTSAPMTLPELVKISEYILGGDVVNVRMTDQGGKEILELNARTGPGLENTLHLDVMVDQKLILKSRSSQIPTEISIPLAPLQPMSLGQAQKYLREKSFFLLDKTFQPAHPDGFQLPVTEQRKLESIIRRVGNP
jgi:hypothetical protein